MSELLRAASALRRTAGGEEHNFVMFKPLAVAKGLVPRLKDSLEKLEAVFEECEKVRCTPSLISRHYEEHRARPFFPALLDYYDGKVVEACRVGGPEGIILRIRRRLGPSDPLSCIPEEHLRALAIPMAHTGETHGVDNLVHASDSPSSARRELALWGLDADISRERAASRRRILLASAPVPWDAWTRAQTGPAMDAAAEKVGRALVRAFEDQGAGITDTEVQRTPDGGRTVWFLPDAEGCPPVYLEPGREGAYVANSAGVRGRLLGKEAGAIVLAILDKEGR